MSTREPLALVVDDLSENRLLLVEILKANGFQAIEAQDGDEAIHLSSAHHPDLIVLDEVMTRVDGLEALERIRKRDPMVPVVVITAAENDQIAGRALRLGAVNFIRRPFDPAEIGFVVERIRSTIEEEGAARAVLGLVTERQTHLEVPNDLGLIHGVITYLGRELHHHYPTLTLPMNEVKLAMHEALANAIEHGNLEIGYQEKAQALRQPGTFRKLIEERRTRSPYRDRLVRVAVRYAPERVTYRVADEGRGFQPNSPITATAAPTVAPNGRGILLMRHFASELSWNEAGNEIQLTFELPREGLPDAD